MLFLDNKISNLPAAPYVLNMTHSCVGIVGFTIKKRHIPNHVPIQSLCIILKFFKGILIIAISYIESHFKISSNGKLFQTTSNGLPQQQGLSVDEYFTISWEK